MNSRPDISDYDVWKAEFLQASIGSARDAPTVFTERVPIKDHRLLAHAAPVIQTERIAAALDESGLEREGPLEAPLMRLEFEYALEAELAGASALTPLGCFEGFSVVPTGDWLNFEVCPPACLFAFQQPGQLEPLIDPPSQDWEPLGCDMAGRVSGIKEHLVDFLVPALFPPNLALPSPESPMDMAPRFVETPLVLSLHQCPDVPLQRSLVPVDLAHPWTHTVLKASTASIAMSLGLEFPVELREYMLLGRPAINEAWPGNLSRAVHVSVELETSKSFMSLETRPVVLLEPVAVGDCPRAKSAEAPLPVPKRLVPAAPVEARNRFTGQFAHGTAWFATVGMMGKLRLVHSLSSHGVNLVERDFGLPGQSLLALDEHTIVWVLEAGELQDTGEMVVVCEELARLCTKLTVLVLTWAQTCLQKALKSLMLSRADVSGLLRLVGLFPHQLACFFPADPADLLAVLHRVGGALQPAAIDDELSAVRAAS